jgi:hypothetical protein
VSSLARTPQGDFALTVGANGLKNLTLISGGQSIADKLRDRFGMALGTWFLNTLEGVPYLQVVLVKNPNLSNIRQLFRSVILSTPGIASLIDLALTLTGRNLQYQFQAVLTTGETLTGGSGIPFVVNPGTPT